ncbi:hypothetical protein ACTVLL_23215, partial [Serratia nevei]|uniref:hypothetical protein n=1 Tax=Serratia nevei TaxID=2703794 RepID=UPI003FA6AB4F
PVRPRKAWVCRRDKQQKGREGRSVMVCVSVDVGCVKKNQILCTSGMKGEDIYGQAFCGSTA